MVEHTAGGAVVCSQSGPWPVAMETLLFRSLQDAVRLTQWKQGPNDVEPNDVTEQKAAFYFSEKIARVLYGMLLISQSSNRSKEIVDLLPPPPLFGDTHVCCFVLRNCIPSGCFS